MKSTPPVDSTPLRASAHIFAAAAGYDGWDVKLRGSRETPRGIAAWDVFVSSSTRTRGERIGTMIERACEPFGFYRYTTDLPQGERIMNFKSICRAVSAKLRRFLWRHHWRKVDEQRTCTTCDRCEVNDGDDWGSFWIVIRPGDKSRHNGSEA